MPSLLVTNDFPPKVGGIQSYLWELWRRLPAADVNVLTTRWEDADEFDRSQAYPVERLDAGLLLPSPSLARGVRRRADASGAGLVFLDPVVPLGAIGPRLDHPYVVIVHGAEVTVYAHVPAVRQVMRRVLRRAHGVVAAGGYPADQAQRVAGRPVPTLNIPPGVDTERFRPVDASARAATRHRYGLDPDRPLVLGVSRLVPRKGFDVLIDAVARLPAEVQLAIAGAGRDRARLERRARERGVADRTTFVGRVDDDALPALYAAADVFSMLCRDRWGGLEAEGFGIVFLEAAACGVPAVAGRSGGSHEAVVDGETGFVVDPHDVDAVTDRLSTVLGDDSLRRRLGDAARERAQAEFEYDALARRLAPLAAGDLSALA